MSNDGEIHRIAWSYSVMRYGDALGLAATGIDIADRESGAATGEDAVWEYDYAADRCTFAPRTWLQRLGIVPGERQLSGAEWQTRIHPDDIGLHLERMAAHESGDTPACDSEFRIRGKNGGWVSVLNRAAIVQRELDGRPLRMVGATREIASPRQPEKGADEAVRELRSVVDASPLAMVQVDLEGTVLRWNLAATHLFGWSESEVLGRQMPVVPPADLRAFRRKVSCLGQDDHATGFETRRLCKDGSLVDVSVRTAPARDAAGYPTGVIIEYADLAERKNLESRIHEDERMEALTKLAGGIAHDFNNLFTTMLGYTSLVASSAAIGVEQRAQLEEVLAAGERATELTRQLLVFSKRSRLQLTNCDLNEVVRDMAGILTRLAGERIRIDLSLGADLRPVKIGRVHMDQVLMNLVANAEDAMPDGGTLNFSTATCAVGGGEADQLGIAPGSYAALTVSDSGVGMPTGLRGHVFEPFFTTKSPSQGKGLGLSTVYGLVRQVGGSINVSSTIGQGTSFTIHLPVAQQPAEGVSPQSNITHNSGRGAVMVVEDDPGVRAYTQELLQSNGYLVTEMATPAEALEFARDPLSRIDLVLSDVGMPGMNGVELIERLKQLRPALKCVLMSGYPDRQQQLSKSVSRHAFLQKPFSRGALLATLQAELPPPS
jgi:two-component system cell cycle sensor histidine kinase/response regulator CckA